MSSFPTHLHEFATPRREANPSTMPPSVKSNGKHAISPTTTTTSVPPSGEQRSSSSSASADPLLAPIQAGNNQPQLYTDDTSLQPQPSHAPPRVYKRRFFGLIQLSLLNIVVSWIWLTYAPVSATSATFFNVSISTINWLSTGFLFAFAVASPVSLFVLNRHGPRGAMIVATVLIIVGSWLRYAGARARGVDGKEGMFALVVVGQVLGGMAQPFVLSAPTYYSELWFGEKGRITATAIMSLANPFGGAVSLLSERWGDTDVTGKQHNANTDHNTTAWPTHRPILGNKTFLHPRLDTLGCHNRHRPQLPFLLPPLQTTNTTKHKLIDPSAASHPPRPKSTSTQPLLLPPRHPLHNLRLRLQRHILASRPNTHTLWLLRDRIRHRRRAAHPRWSRLCRRLIPISGPETAAGVIVHQADRSCDCRVLSGADLGSANGQCGRRLYPHGHSRRRVFQPGAACARNAC